MISAKQKLTRILFALGIAAFLLTSFLGLFHFGMTMDTEGNMTMSDCPFMIGMTLCNMNLFEHIATWQSMFAHILPHHHSTAVLLLLVSVSLLILGRITQLYPPPSRRLKQFISFSDPEYIPTIKPLQNLFSNGILNAKLF